MIKRISVFCGSGHGSDPVYTDAARRLGLLLVDKNIGLVFGGGNIGLMGEIAGTVIKGGGDQDNVFCRISWKL
jgi:predicted Rossmann-fold nucleotide-binding protein